MMICICGVCIPLSSLWPLLLLVLQPVYNFLRSLVFGPEPQPEKAKKEAVNNDTSYAKSVGAAEACCTGTESKIASASCCTTGESVSDGGSSPAKHTGSSECAAAAGPRLVEVSEDDGGDSSIDAIKRSPRGALVRFTAPWCKPCKRIEPHFFALAEAYPEVTFATVDVDKTPEVGTDHGVMMLPAFHFYRAGELLGQAKGEAKDGLSDLMRTHTGPPAQPPAASDDK
jgi:thioredoxin 1